jgi:hypothetical protein
MSESKRADVGDVDPLLNVGFGKPDIDSTTQIAKQVTAYIRGTCRECGAHFQTQRASREFCCTKCRHTFHNRAASRGAELFHLFMAMRFDRANAEESGAWSLMCRLAASFKAKDDRDRNGRRSWDDVQKVKQRNAALASTVVGLNADGMGRRRSVRISHPGPRP